MTRQLLIYERAVVVSSQRHRDWSVKTGADYSFTREVNSVPLMAVEFPNATAEYAIVFAGPEESLMPAVILGIRDRENLYLNEVGGWEAQYLPAFVRRYPFVFSGSDDGGTFTLCIDEKFSGCNQEGRGERLFDAEGQRTQYLESILAFLRDYQAHFHGTRAFCRKIKELGLLEPMRAQITLKTGQRLALEGFMAVNRERLKNLSSDALAALAKAGELELLYLHLQSMRNFRAMLDRVASATSDSAETSGTPRAGDGGWTTERAGSEAPHPA